MSLVYSEIASVATDLSQVATAPQVGRTKASKNRPCPICGGHDGCYTVWDGQSRNALHGCRKVSGWVGGYREAGTDKLGWSTYVVDDGQPASARSARPQVKIAPQLKAVLDQPKRAVIDREFHKSFEQAPLSEEQRKFLYSKNLTDAQIDGNFYTIERKKYNVSPLLPVFKNGYSRMAGMLIPVYDADGLVVRCQIRYFGGKTKYAWFSKDGELDKFGGTGWQNLNRNATSGRLILTESTGSKVHFVAAQFPDDYVLGAAGFNFGRAEKFAELNKFIADKGFTEVLVIPDAGALRRSLKASTPGGYVSPAIAKTLTELTGLENVAVRFLYWGQLGDKTIGDFDEISAEKRSAAVEIEPQVLLGINKTIEVNFLNKTAQQLNPDLEVNERYLSAEMLPRNFSGVLYIKSAKNTGKTTLVKWLIKQALLKNSDAGIIGTVPRKTLGRKSTSDLKELGAKYLGNGESVGQFTILCGESLHKIPSDHRVDVLILDEADLILEQLQTGSTCGYGPGKPGRARLRLELRERIRQVIRNNGLILVLGADIKQMHVDYFNAIVPDARHFVLQNNFKPNNGKVLELDKELVIARFVQDILDLQTQWENGTLNDWNLPYLYSDSKALGEAIFMQLEQKLTPEFQAKFSVMLVNRDTVAPRESGDNHQAELLAELFENPENIRDKNVVGIIASPTLATGVDLNVPFIKRVYAVSEAVNTSDEFCQGTARPRQATELLISLSYPMPASMNGIKKPKTYQDVLRYWQTINKAAHDAIDAEFEPIDQIVEMQKAAQERDPAYQVPDSFLDDFKAYLSNPLDGNNPDIILAAKITAYRNANLAGIDNEIRTRLAETYEFVTDASGYGLECLDSDETKEDIKACKAEAKDRKAEQMTRYCVESELTEDEIREIKQSDSATLEKKLEAESRLIALRYPGFDWNSEVIRKYFVSYGTDRKIEARWVRENTQLAKQDILTRLAKNFVDFQWAGNDKRSEIKHAALQALTADRLLGEIQPETVLTEEILTALETRYKALAWRDKTALGVQYKRYSKNPALDLAKDCLALFGLKISKRGAIYTVKDDPVLVELTSCYTAGLEAKAKAEQPEPPTETHNARSAFTDSQINDLAEWISLDPQSAWDNLLEIYNDQPTFDEDTIFDVLDRLPRDSEILQLGKRLKTDRPELYSRAGQRIKNRFLGA